MVQAPTIAAYIKADSQNAANMQYRVIMRFINENLPGGTCFFFCDHGTDMQVEFNRLMYLAGKRKFTNIVTCSRDNLPTNIVSILHLTDLTLSVIHDNYTIRIIPNNKRT